jgi:hypothetical protein
MADKKISELDVVTARTPTDLIPLVVGGVSKAISVANFLTDLSDYPVDLKISTASKGGLLKCIDKATGDIAQTTNLGFIEDEKYNFMLREVATSMSTEFDSAVRRTGKFTLKVETLDITGTGYAGYGGNTVAESLTNYIAVKPSTAYRVNCYAKTNNVAADAVYIRVVDIDTEGTAGTIVYTNKLTGTNDWTLLTVSFTSAADAALAKFECYNYIAGNVSQAWFDINSITIEEIVTDNTFTGKVAEKIRPVLQAVTSTGSGNEDQALDRAGAYANTYALTDAVNEGATHIQTFTPTKKYTTQIGIWPIDNGTGNWTLVVHTAGNVVVASKTIANASVAEGAMLYFDVPNIWASGALHFHLYSSVADGTCKANTSNDLETASYIQRYAKKSEGFTLISNGIKTELKADKDGLLTGSIIDLDNGKYRYNLTGGASIPSVADMIAFSNNVFSASSGGATGAAANGIAGINGWYGDPVYGIYSANDATARTMILKVNTLLPIKHLKFLIGMGRNTAYSFDVSPDNVTYTTLTYATASELTKQYPETDLLNGLSSFYIRLNKTTASAFCMVAYLGIEADLDTSSAPTGFFYPLATNQFTETVKLPITADRVYFQSAKYTNEYGVVMPALEFCSTAVPVGYVPLKIDNTQETSPCVSILSTTTNYQQSGTGSAVTNGYVLNTGEYMTLTSAVAELKIDYQVGTGTTAIAAITKNTMYLSSNGEDSDSTQDPSYQANFIVGVRQQGLTDRVKDLGNEIAGVREGIVKSSKWTEWTPTLTWTTGTPEGSVVTKARHKIVDGVCDFSFYYSATDGNGATALTISLPVLPKDNDTLTSLSSQELSDTTWSNPLAYIEDGATTITFRSLTTIADTKAVKILVTGSYEI